MRKNVWIRIVGLSFVVLTGCGRPPSGQGAPPTAQGAPPTAEDAPRVEEVDTWPPSGGIRPQFKWTPMVLERRDVDEELGADGKVTRTEDRTPSRIVVTASSDGGVQISFPEDHPAPNASPFERALSRAYHLLHIVTRPDGQIDHVAGIDDFIAAVKADPESAEQRHVLDDPNIREVIDASVSQDYVAWIVTWLDSGWVPEAGRSVRRVVGANEVMTMSSESLEREAPGRMLLRLRVEGPATKISVHTTFLDGLVPPERFEEASGHYQIELVTDPRTLIPVRATVEKELTAGSGTQEVRGWRRTTSTFVLR